MSSEVKNKHSLYRLIAMHILPTRIHCLRHSAYHEPHSKHAISFIHLTVNVKTDVHPFMALTHLAFRKNLHFVMSAICMDSFGGRASD